MHYALCFRYYFLDYYSPAVQLCSSYRSIKKLHNFKVLKEKETTQKSEGKVSYMTFKNSFYISEISPENTFDIYSSGGGMVKRYMFRKVGSKIEKIEEKVITIR